MSTLRISNIEAKSVPASATIDEKVKITNSSGDPLVFIDGKTSGITTVGINTTDPNITFDANSNIVVTGIITATRFSGEITPTSLEIGSNIKLGNAGVITATSFVGSGAQLTGITSPAITSIDNDAVSRVLTTDGDGTATAHSEVKIETVSGNKRFSINRGTGSTEVPLLVRRTDASGIVAEFSNSSGYGVYIGQNGATGEGYIRTATGQPLVFTTNSGSGIANERVRIDSAGRIGIGENNPTRDIVIKKSGSVQVSMVGATNQNVFLNFGDTDDDNIGGVIYDNGNNRMIIRANTNDAVQVKSNGNMAINDGDLEIGTAGHGINFSATGDAAGNTSELLDDYEEGSWTPYIYPMSSNIPVTYSHQSGRYQKIGNVVHFQFKLQVSNITGNRNQGFGISGFPYNNTGSQDYQTTGQFFGVTWDGEMPTTLVFTPNTTRGVCYYYADAMKYYSSSMLDINVNNSMLSGSGHYFTHV